MTIFLVYLCQVVTYLRTRGVYKGKLHLHSNWFFKRHKLFKYCCFDNCMVFLISVWSYFINKKHKLIVFQMYNFYFCFFFALFLFVVILVNNKKMFLKRKIINDKIIKMLLKIYLKNTISNFKKWKKTYCIHSCINRRILDKFGNWKRWVDLYTS